MVENLAAIFFMTSFTGPGGGGGMAPSPPPPRIRYWISTTPIKAPNSTPVVNFLVQVCHTNSAISSCTSRDKLDVSSLPVFYVHIILSSGLTVRLTSLVQNKVVFSIKKAAIFRNMGFSEVDVWRTLSTSSRSTFGSYFKVHNIYRLLTNCLSIGEFSQ